ncbi:hypothetical protein ADUPG1_007023, partial [Aduncisulcus paluster]
MHMELLGVLSRYSIPLLKCVIEPDNLQSIDRDLSQYCRRSGSTMFGRKAPSASVARRLYSLLPFILKNTISDTVSNFKLSNAQKERLNSFTDEEVMRKREDWKAKVESYSKKTFLLEFTKSEEERVMKDVEKDIQSLGSGVFAHNYTIFGDIFCVVADMKQKNRNAQFFGPCEKHRMIDLWKISVQSCIVTHVLCLPSTTREEMLEAQECVVKRNDYFV